METPKFGKRELPKRNEGERNRKKKSKKRVNKKEDDYENLVQTILLSKYLAMSSLNYLDEECDSCKDLPETNTRPKIRVKNFTKIKRSSSFLTPINSRSNKNKSCFSDYIGKNKNTKSKFAPTTPCIIPRQNPKLLFPLILEEDEASEKSFEDIFGNPNN